MRDGDGKTWSRTTAGASAGPASRPGRPRWARPLVGHSESHRADVDGGPFWAAKGWPDLFVDETLELDAHHEHIVFTQFTAPDRPLHVRAQDVWRAGVPHPPPHLP